MATKVVMEALSPTMEEGRLIEWKKKEGDAVKVGDVLADVETDKAVMELVARAEGTLLKQVVAAGATIPVSDVVGWIGKPGEAVETDTADKTDKTDKAGGTGNSGGAAGPKPEPVEAPKPERRPEPAPAAARAPAAATATAAPPARSNGERVKASPLARRIANERGIDLASIQGSGPAGRIIQRDVESAQPPAPAPAPAAAQKPAALPARTLVIPPGQAYRDVPLTQIRKTIARRLVQSIGPVPTFYLTSEVDMERVADAREAINAVGEGKVSYNDIIIKATALALAQHPECNGWWQDDHIRYWSEVHMGMAVAIEDGLITPVIRHANLKSLRDISAETRDLAARARDRRLTPEEYTGSTFSVSNLGMFDIDEFTAIINPPEAGILAIGRISEQTVPAADGLEVRKRMKITMSCDHRVIDGATGAQFLRTLKRMLENPLAMVW
ncbi:MAG TPA: pyruvate dehydrogenase complex dihydrolipoamide acetyltransferase [Gemmatimonadales bacterium]|jgi:pyruvate dehydrogenase E2 component (dihydrolipoamide acetyltransferase)|nr:pyruvate dehydrogenase complex dihydrolipoamide acetyltransferase [Gemmatimonadales bacterium]